MKTLHRVNRTLVRTGLFALLITAALQLEAQTIVGDTIANTLYVTNNIDMNGTTFTQGAVTISSTNDYRLKILSDANSVHFEQRRATAGDWIWEYNNGTTVVPSAKLDATNKLILYAAGTAGATLDPAAKSLTLGTATLTNTSGTLLTANGAFTAQGNMNFTGADGSLALSASGVALSAVGGNKSVTLNSSGTGDLIFNTAGVERARIKASGYVGIGTPAPTAKLQLGITDAGSVNEGIELDRLGSATSKFSMKLISNAAGYYRGALEFTQNGGPLTEAISIGNEATGSAGNVGIGTISPSFKLDVGGDIRSTGNLVEKRVVFTPTAVGWYRIVSGAGGAGLGEAGGTIRTLGNYDGGTTSVEFIYNIRGWGQGGTLTLTKNTGVNGNIIDSARISTDGGGSMYLDVHISTATTPAPITLYGYGPDMPTFVASPVVGATVGSTNVRVLPIGWSVGAYDDFRTTGNVVTYSNDGSTPQGYIYHGSSGQAAFGNGVTNGETWITRTGGGGSIKLGDYDLNTAYLTVTGSTGNVGIGTTTPSHKLAVNGTIRAKEVIVDTGWADYVFEESYRLAPLSEVESHIRANKHLPGIPSAAEVAEHGVSMGDMQSKLLSKVEELTLHLIRIDKENAILRQQVAELKASSIAP